ncbi:MAG: trypsin-like peptidase domain-containing protein [Parvibaculum sp.]|nr:trypsin-like peptidase domain-containing protein [Parvibaculum sp.]
MNAIGNPWTFTASHLEMFFGDQLLASGSGFFWKDGERTFLVSNWHNFSGINPTTGQPLSSSGGRPTKIQFSAFKKMSEEDEKGFFELNSATITIRICADDLSLPVWLEHPKFGKAVDVAVLDVTKPVRGLHIMHANTVEADAVLEPSASQEVFIIGFPLGRLTRVPTPIWKRGSIATEPTYDPNDLPSIYVDTASRTGMSGSMVIARHTVVGKSVTRKDGSESNTYLYAIQDVFLGVYSGRLGADEFKAQLGIVWKRQVLEEIISAGVPPNI